MNKLQEIRAGAEAILPPCEYLSIRASEGIASMVHIRGSFDSKSDWKYGIYQNSRYFQFFVTPVGRKRFFEPSDTRVTVELGAYNYTLPKFRKYTGPIDKALARIVEWINDNKASA